MTNRFGEVGLRHRPSRVIPAAIVAGLMVLVGAAAVIAAIGRLASGRTDSATTAVLRWLAAMHWNDPAVLVLAGLLAVAGVVLIIAAVAPGRYNGSELAVQPPAGSDTVKVGILDVVLPKRSLERLVSNQVGTVDGVDQVQVRARPRRLRVEVATATRYTDDVKRQVCEVVDQTLHQRSGLQDPPKFRVIVRQQS